MSKPRSNALRKGRYSESGRIYLLTTTTWNRTPFFVDIEIGRFVVSAMRHLALKQEVESMAFVVMPDHLHWLLALQDGATLPSVMHALKGYSAIRINQALQRRGPIWQSGYHDRALRREDDLQAMARYVVANPLRAGLVQKPGDCPLWDAVWL